MFEIRPGRPEDASAIANFQVAMAAETENKKLDFEIVLAAAEAVFADANKGFYLVAESNGEVCGSLMVTYEWSDWRNSNMWWIQSVFVTEPMRGQGVFKAMYHQVIEMATAENVMFVRLYVETENLDAQKAYESLGMKKMPYFMYDIKI